MKNELIQTDSVSFSELSKITELCLNFFKRYIPNVNIIDTKIGFDIEYKGNELGSYGIRECEFLKFFSYFRKLSYYTFFYKCFMVSHYFTIFIILLNLGSAHPVPYIHFKNSHSLIP
jgi:hypothetical protein